MRSVVQKFAGIISAFGTSGGKSSLVQSRRMLDSRFVRGFLLLTSGFFLAAGTGAAEVKILNVSYDVTREFYQDYNTAFAAYWKTKTGDTVAISQSHGGSSKQAQSVLNGLEADVVTMNQPPDIDILNTSGGLIPANWSSRLPNKSVPYTSTIVFVVRKGNPKNIRNWDDLVQSEHFSRHPESENLRQWALQLSGGVGICAEEIRR